MGMLDSEITPLPGRKGMEDKLTTTECYTTVNCCCIIFRAKNNLPIRSSLSVECDAVRSGINFLMFQKNFPASIFTVMCDNVLKMEEASSKKVCNFPSHYTVSHPLREQAP
jgi:hypothetical protein